MSETRVYTLKEVEEESTSSKPLLVINNAVYDVTTFLNEHPGGEEVLLEQSGKDASEQFEDVGHSSDAREMMTKYKIGDIAESDRKKEVPKEKPRWEAAETDTSRMKLRSVIGAECAGAKMVESDVKKFSIPKIQVPSVSECVMQKLTSWTSWILPAALAIAGTVLYRFFFTK